MNITTVRHDFKAPFPLNPIGQRVHRWLKYAGALSAPAAIFLILALQAISPRVDFHSNFLLLGLNTLFITVIGLVVAAIAAWSYSKSGSLSLLLLGCASLAFALGALFSGLLGYSSDHANGSVTVYNITALGAALLHVAGAVTVSTGRLVRRKPRLPAITILYSYIGVLALTEILAFSSSRALMPVFFVDGEGPTLLRQLVLGLAIVLFASSAGLFFRFYFKSHSDLAYWYAMALGMLAIGLWSMYPSQELSNAQSWVGRFTQYLGSVYLLVAVLTVKVSPGSRIPLKEALTAFLYEARENYQALVETATDAISVADADDRILVWNSKAEELFGYAYREAIGNPFIDLIFAPEQSDWLRTELRKARAGQSSAILHGTLEMTGVRKNGERFPVEFTASMREMTTGWVTTLIIRDVTERKRSQQTQHISQQRLNLALQNAPIFLSSQDRELRYTWIESFRNDLPSDEFIGRTDKEVFPADQANTITALKRQVLESGQGLRAEIALTTRFGLEHFDLSIEPMRDPEGNTLGVYGVGIDVTERKHLLDAVKAERSRWQVTVESMVSAVIVLDQNGSVAFANPAAIDMMGDITRKDLIPSQRPAAFGLFRADGATLYTFEDLPVQRAFREGAPIRDAEMVCRRSSDTLTVLKWNAAPLLDAEGQVVGAVGIGQDVTAKRRSELEREDLLHQAQRERDKLQALVESIVDEVWFSDAAENITLLNPGNVVGSIDQRGKLPSETDFATIEPKKEEQVLLRSLRGEIIHNEDQVFTNPATGLVHYRQVSAAPISDREGNIIGAVAIARDVTDQRRAEQRIEELNRDLKRRAIELQEANRDLESFAYSVSHDLRTPLTSIDSFSRLVLADYAKLLPAEGQRYLQLIRENAYAMDTLIRDLLAFSRAGRQPLKTDLVDMNGLVRQVLEELKQLQIGRNVELVINDLPPVEADAALIKQVWINLLTNAFKFTRRRQDAYIEIGCWNLESGMWVLDNGTYKFDPAVGARADPGGLQRAGNRAFYVRDNGVGFAADEADKLFGVFQRLHSEEEYEGTGVGLAIVQRVVSRHGGRVWAMGDEGLGAMFCFTL